MISSRNTFGHMDLKDCGKIDGTAYKSQILFRFKTDFTLLFFHLPKILIIKIILQFLFPLLLLDWFKLFICFSNIQFVAFKVSSNSSIFFFFSPISRKYCYYIALIISGRSFSFSSHIFCNPWTFLFTNYKARLCSWS